MCSHSGCAGRASLRNNVFARTVPKPSIRKTLCVMVPSKSRSSWGCGWEMTSKRTHVSPWSARGPAKVDEAGSRVHLGLGHSPSLCVLGAQIPEIPGMKEFPGSGFTRVPGTPGIPDKHKFIGFGDSQGPTPYIFLRFGDIQGPKPYKFIGFGDIQGPKPYNLILFGDIQVVV